MKKIGGEPFPENKAIQDMKTIYGPSKNNPPNRKQFMQLPKPMSLSNKELLDKIKDEVWNHAYPFGNGEWKSGRNDDLWPIVCERYATEKAKELLPKEKKEPTNYSTDPVIVKIGEGLEFKFSKRPTTVESSEPQEPIITEYSNDPVLIKYEYSEPQEKEQTYSSEFVGVLQRLISKLSMHNKNLFEEIERLKAEVLREKFPPN